MWASQQGSWATFSHNLFWKDLLLTNRVKSAQREPPLCHLKAPQMDLQKKGRKKTGGLVFGICPHSGESFSKPPWLRTIWDTADLQCRTVASRGELSDARTPGDAVNSRTLGGGCWGTELTGFPGSLWYLQGPPMSYWKHPRDKKRGLGKVMKGVISPWQIKKIHFTYLIYSWQQKESSLQGKKFGRKRKYPTYLRC